MKKKILYIIITIGLVLGFTAISMAADADIYSSIRFATAWDSYDTDTVDDSDLRWGLQGNSRLGVKLKSGDLSGKVELGFTGNNSASSRGDDAVYTRQVYGVWNFGSGDLLVGQTYTPLWKPYSNDCCDDDNALNKHGEMYDGRNPMIQLKFDTFKLAFISPDPNDAAYNKIENTDVTIPKIAASYSIPMNMITTDLWAGYQTYETVDAALVSVDIDSYVVGFGLMTDLNPAYVNFKIWMAQNAGDYGMSGDGNYRTYDITTNEDSETLAGLLIAGFRVNEKLNFEAGIGYQKHERSLSEESEIIEYYMNAKIDITKGFFILPELAYFDYGDDVNAAGLSTDKGDRTVFLVKWQIDL